MNALRLDNRIFFAMAIAVSCLFPTRWQGAVRPVFLPMNLGQWHGTEVPPTDLERQLFHDLQGELRHVVYESKDFRPVHLIVTAGQPPHDQMVCMGLYRVNPQVVAEKTFGQGPHAVSASAIRYNIDRQKILAFVWYGTARGSFYPFRDHTNAFMMEHRWSDPVCAMYRVRTDADDGEVLAERRLCNFLSCWQNALR